MARWKAYAEKVGGRIWADIKQYSIAVLAAAVYCLLANLLLHAFCPMVIFTGLPCPGCGMSRAAFYLLSGRWGMAWRVQPMVFPAAAAAVYFFGSRYLFGKKAKGFKYILSFIIILMAVFYLCRMYLYFPDREPYVYHAGNLTERVLKGLYPFWE